MKKKKFYLSILKGTVFVLPITTIAASGCDLLNSEKQDKQETGVIPIKGNPKPLPVNPSPLPAPSPIENPSHPNQPVEPIGTIKPPKQNVSTPTEPVEPQKPIDTKPDDGEKQPPIKSGGENKQSPSDNQQTQPENPDPVPKQEQKQKPEQPKSKTDNETSGGMQNPTPLQKKDFLFGNILKIQPNEVYWANGLSQEQKDAALNAYNKPSVSNIEDIKEKTDNTGRKYLEYQDPFTNVLFRDYAYPIEGTKDFRYLLGKHGLIALAQEFKRKVPFGPEVYDLQAINIDDFNVINAQANGLYIPNIKNIFINGSNYAEKGFNEYEIIGGLMPTIFHEYMHHWSDSYSEATLPSTPTALIDQRIRENTKFATIIYYNPGLNIEENDNSHSHGLKQYWNSYFANNFYKLLNYDVDEIGYISDEDAVIFNRFNDGTFMDNLDNFLFRRLSPRDIWEIANDENAPRRIQRFRGVDNFYYSPSLAFKLDYGRLKYNYSLTELVPREYSKYAFESYFSINAPNQAAYNDTQQKATINWFGVHYFKNDGNGNISKYFSPSAIAEDWSKVYMNNFDSSYRQGTFLNGYRTLDGQNDTRVVNATMTPNSVFDIRPYIFERDYPVGYDILGQPVYEKRLYHLPERKTINRSQKFYDLFLATMGYGKSINQMFYQNQWGWNNKQVYVDETKANQIKFSGFLPTKKYTGLVLKDPSSTNYTKAYFNYYDTFSFFGHKTLDTGATVVKNGYITDDRKEQIANRIYPGHSNDTSMPELNRAYYSYITKDFVSVKPDQQVFLWEDKNNDGQVQSDELNTSDISLPKNRWVTSGRAWNTSQPAFKKFKLSQNADGKVYIRLA
ncbi:MYPU_1760 family metalloprotease [Mycoplasma sp. 4423]